MAKLNPLQRRFVAHLLADPRRNRTAAARKAGVTGTRESLRVKARRLFTNVHVQSAIRAAADVVADPVDILAELATVAYQRMSDYADLLACADMEAAKAELARLKAKGLDHAIKDISPNRQGAPVVRFYDKIDAAVRLGMYRGMWVEKHQLEFSDDDLNSLTVEELQLVAKGKVPDRVKQSLN